MAANQITDMSVEKVEEGRRLVIVTDVDGEARRMLNMSRNRLAP